MSPSFCPACGAKLEPAATTCTSCGQRVAPEIAPAVAAPVPAPATPQAALAAPQPGMPDLPICLGCGIVAPAGLRTCPECGYSAGSSPGSVPRTTNDLIWAGVRASTKCRACGGDAPIDGMDLGGVYPCVQCGIEQHMDPHEWTEGLEKAHDVADLAGPGNGAFPSGKPLAHNEYAAIGNGQRVSVLVTTSFDPQNGIPLRLEVSPGHPLCEACHVPLELRSASDPLVVVCPRCAQSHAYSRPAGAPPEVVGVVGHHHEQGVHDVTAERDAGGAVAIRCPSCSAPLPAADIGAAVKCEYCGVTSRIGPAMRHAMGARDATPPRWWALLRGPSQGRRRAERAAAEEVSHELAEVDEELARAEKQHRSARKRMLFIFAIVVAWIVLLLLVLATGGYSPDFHHSAGNHSRRNPPPH